jgi:hypothetical protein
MVDNPKFESLIEGNFDFYRDLDLVLDSDFCKENGFNHDNTLQLDSCPKKVQTNLDNSMVVKEYEWTDVIEDNTDNQSKYLSDLAD